MDEQAPHRRRLRLLIEYDGTQFVGWQRQNRGLSVQRSIENAFSKFVGHHVDVMGAGRTDSGVHATGQVAHIDLSTAHSVNVVQSALNAHLRDLPISILAVEETDHQFNARFSAVQRIYRYQILNRRAPPAIGRGRFWHVIKPLDVRTMDFAAKLLLGTHDFSSFRSAHCQAKSPRRTLDALTVCSHGEEIIVEARARSFLHRQVRSMTGSLVWIGRGKQPVHWISRVLADRDHGKIGPVAPAHGLTLVRVHYRE